jgi:hypothetical protein
MHNLPPGRGCLRIAFGNLPDHVCLTPEIWSYIRSSLDYTISPTNPAEVRVADYMQYAEAMRVYGGMV